MTEQWVTIEYCPVPGCPRRITRFPKREDGNYSLDLPDGSTIINVWAPTRDKKE